MPTVRCRFTIVSGPTGDAWTDGGVDWEYGHVAGQPSVDKNGTITFAISQVDGFSFDGGATWTGPPAGFHLDGSTVTIAAALGQAGISGSTIFSIARLQCDSTQFSASPVAYEIDSPNTGAGVPAMDWPDRLLSLFDLTGFVLVTARCKGNFNSAGGASVSVKVNKVWEIQGDYVIIKNWWETKPCADGGDHLRYDIDSPGTDWQAYGSPGPVPHIDLVDPPAGSRGGGQAVTITGSGFDDDCQVLFGDLAADDVVVVSQYEITCTTPLAGSPDAHAPGVVQVTVVNSDGTASVP